MIQDFQQSTEQWARRWEDQCIYCTTIALTYKKYCRVRLVLFAGVTHSNTHTHHVALARPAASLQSTGHCAVAWHASHSLQTHALSFEMPQLLSPLYLHSTPWNAGVHTGDTHAHPQQRRLPEMCGQQTQMQICKKSWDSRTYADSSPPKVRGRGLTRIINSNSALGKLTHLAQWADAIVLTDALYPSHPRDHAAQLQLLIVLQWPSNAQMDWTHGAAAGGPCVEWVRKRVTNSRTDSGSETASACGHCCRSVVRIHGLMRT